ncbi:hypothetical protein B6U98_02310 [Thermoplasmatales archaeon ex4572_165]|nr:MAG: hypothetical protein B6U98_02310 [Thermoplasmatales archaeon ex4572_165]RLF60036.1 MAG: hypothetical protein DRN27_00810 [Thermoplasmata archaeon]
MKKGIILGIGLITMLLLITPVIPANEYNLIENAQDQIINNIESKNNLKETISNTLMQSINQKGSQRIISFLLNLIISLIFSGIATIFAIIFGPLLAIFVKIITAPAMILAKIIELIFGSINSYNQ